MARRFGRSILFTLFVGSFWMAPPLGAMALKRPAIQLTLVIRNYARLPAPVLESAKAHVVETFAAIDVHVGFLDCDIKDSEHEICTSDGPENGPRLNLHLEPHSFLLQLVDAMGVAQENNQTEYVFYDRIESTVREFETESQMNASLSLMLACIISHEVGHLLLRTKLDHRAGTIMRPTWGVRDIREIEVRGVTIGDDQASPCEGL